MLSKGTYLLSGTSFMHSQYLIKNKKQNKKKQNSNTIPIFTHEETEPGSGCCPSSIISQKAACFSGPFLPSVLSTLWISQESVISYMSFYYCFSSSTLSVQSTLYTDHLELLIFLPPHLQCWAYTILLFYMVLGAKPRGSSMLGK